MEYAGTSTIYIRNFHMLGIKSLEIILITFTYN